MQLHQLPTGQVAIIRQLRQDPVADAPDDPISRRLATLGFMPGERIQITARGLFGGEPLLAMVGVSRFALRRNEAARIEVEPCTS